MNILIISGHPDLNQSHANKAILDALKQHQPEACFVRLDDLYPDFKIDIEVEQQRLQHADVIVLQFPFFWYGMPSLLKKWVEDVFTYGFAHGMTGNKLRGKKLIVSFTSGAPEEMYRHSGPQGYPIDEFLPPLKQLANLCGMEWQSHVYSGGVSYLNGDDAAALERMRELSLTHAQRLADQIEHASRH